MADTANQTFSGGDNNLGSITNQGTIEVSNGGNIKVTAGNGTQFLNQGVASCSSLNVVKRGFGPMGASTTEERFFQL